MFFANIIIYPIYAFIFGYFFSIYLDQKSVGLVYALALGKALLEI